MTGGNQNNRKMKSSFFSRLTKRQKTTKQTSTSVNALQLQMDQVPLNYANHGTTSTSSSTSTSVSKKGSVPIMSAVDNTPPSLQSLCSSQSSDDTCTRSNHEKMQETVVASNQGKSLYATGTQNFAELDAEFLEARNDRSFADLESSAQFSVSMSMDVDDEKENDTTTNVQTNVTQGIVRNDKKPRGKKVAFAPNLHSPLDTTSDSMPLPVLSTKQKETVEPTLFELDSSLLSALSAINPVEESFSDESKESQDRTPSDLQESDLTEEDDLSDDVADGETAEEGSNVFSLECMQERLSCIGCI